MENTINTKQQNHLGEQWQCKVCTFFQFDRIALKRQHHGMSYSFVDWPNFLQLHVTSLRTFIWSAPQTTKLKVIILGCCFNSLCWYERVKQGVLKNKGFITMQGFVCYYCNKDYHVLIPGLLFINTCSEYPFNCLTFTFLQLYIVLFNPTFPQSLRFLLLFFSVIVASVLLINNRNLYLESCKAVWWQCLLGKVLHNWATLQANVKDQNMQTATKSNRSVLKWAFHCDL